MARCKLYGMDEIISDLGKFVDNLDKTIDDALDQAGEVLVRNTKSNIRAAANRGYSKGSLAASVSATKSKENKWGHFVAVRPVGQDSRGTRNGEKWAYLEYGVDGYQDAHPFIEETVSQSEAPCTEIVQKVFEDHIPNSVKFWAGL